MSKYGYDFDLFGNPEAASEQSDATINEVFDEQSDAPIGDAFTGDALISDTPISDAPINEDMTSEVSASTAAFDFSAKYSNSAQSSQTAQSSAAVQYAQTSAQSSNLPEINPQTLLEGLNPQQSKAVQYTGPALLIGAGAGSGKTRVLTRRIAWILANHKAWPSQILAITFTNKAAAEMRERLASLIGNSANSMWVSTFHSACVKILRAHGDSIGLKSGFSIYDSSDCERLVKIIASELNIDIKKFTPKLLLSKISDFKNNLVTWQENLKNYAPDYKPGASVSGASSFNAAGNADALYAAVYAEYQNRLSVSNAVDFDDLIMLTVKLLRQNPQVSAYYKRKFRYILVDEYQDTNHAQYVLIRQLAGVGDAGVGDNSAVPQVSAASPDFAASPDSTQLPQSSITVVGDSDQSIYAFRGADIRNIQDFEQDFPNATTIMLEQNYRSTQTILDAANAVISNNTNRKPKKLWTSLGKGSPIVGYVADNAQGEAMWVAQEIARLASEDGVNYSDIAIMYRANSQSRSLEDALIKSGLPYQLVGGTKFYERREVKDALAYLQSIANPDDDVNMRRILNVPKRGLGARAESQITSYAKENSISFWSALSQIDKIAEQIGISSRTFNALKSFRDLMTSLIDFMKANDSKPSKVVENVLNESGLLQDLRESKDPQDEFRVDNLSQLQSVAAEYEQNTPDANVAGFLETTALVADSDQLPDQGEDTGKVTLMTLHTAKGLEYPVVFLTGMEQGTFPHSRCVDNQKELCEERRLAYVGITRAKKILYVTWAAERSQWGKSAEMIQSQFLDEIPADLICWKRTEADVMRAGLRGAGRDFDRDFAGDFAGDFSDDFGNDGVWGDDSYTTYGGSSYSGSRYSKSHYGSSYGSSKSYGKSYGSKSYGSSSYGNSYGKSYGSSYGKSYGSKSGKVTTRIARKSSASYQSQSSTSNLQSSASSLSYKKQSLQEKDNHLNINDFHEGDKISHDTYGLGTVLKTQDKGRNSIITVDFGSDGVKRLMLRVAPIEKL
ncbi:ATP-dependent helicase [Gardnerella piotii]|uniref:DNA 3'-5' helicase n=1 Tax=Gardnerella piotii TaxID=2792977 RepID=A0ABU5MQ05_9BIFI|nr:UvrD-helicase domain-containing protein [Gardnerella piotii]MDZ7544497.1 UvrD-helicase domain-containing protein [Gardnerella piotii]MDZ7552137.1 UvrD-helicase domain-containing protein [Gardnerella piotii]